MKQARLILSLNGMVKTEKTVFLITVLILVLTSCTLKTAEKASEIVFYISPKGSDSQNGEDVNNAFATLQRARNAIRKFKQDGALNSAVTVYLLGGTYTLSEPFNLTTQDSGSDEFPITYKAFENETPIISGGIEVRNWGNAELNGNSVLVSDLSALPGGYTAFEQLWVNGHRAIQARTPNSGYLRVNYKVLEEAKPSNKKETMKSLPYLPEDEHHFEDIDDGVAVAFYKWLNYHLPIDRIDRDKDQIIFTNIRYAPSGNK